MSIENFITGHLLCKNVDVYCGGTDKFNGVVVGCADGVLTLETDKGVYTHVAIGKIVAIWAGPEAGKAKKAALKAKKIQKK
jgi:hypothetical protein